MRSLLILALLAFTTLPLLAAKRVSVSKLEEILKTSVAEHKADAEIARRINEVSRPSAYRMRR